MVPQSLSIHTSRSPTKDVWMILGSRFLLILFILIGFVNAPAGYAQCSNNESGDQEFSHRRLHSAEQLISNGHEWQKNALDVKTRIQLLAGKTASPSQLQDEYQSIFQQYQTLLAEYRLHRQAYLEHAKNFHNGQSALHSKISRIQLSVQERQIVDELQGDILRNPSAPSASVDGNTYQPISVSAEQKCQELQQLEASILSTESNLNSMIAQLGASKLSPNSYAALWSQAHGLAVQNMSQANQFNHVGIQKIAQNSRAYHDLISAGVRDGSYTEQVAAYKRFTSETKLEHEIYQRFSMREMSALTSFMKLMSMQPKNLMASSPTAADDLLGESRALDREYTNLQNVFQKLEAVKQALPPSLKVESSAR